MDTERLRISRAVPNISNVDQLALTNLRHNHHNLFVTVKKVVLKKLQSVASTKVCFFVCLLVFKKVL